MDDCHALIPAAYTQHGQVTHLAGEHTCLSLAVLYKPQRQDLLLGDFFSQHPQFFELFTLYVLLRSASLKWNIVGRVRGLLRWLSG